MYTRISRRRFTSYVGRGLFVLIGVRRYLAVPQVEDKRRMVPPFFVLMIHIGKIIEAELRKQERSVTWLAEKLYCDRTNVYKIFKKQSIDTELLLRISHILHVNLFVSYYEECVNVADLSTQA